MGSATIGSRPLLLAVACAVAVPLSTWPAERGQAPEGSGPPAPSTEAPRGTAPVRRTLRVEGEGRVQVAPDVAVVNVAVTVVDASLARATRDANDRARAVLDALRAGGVASGDVQTARYGVQVERRQERGEEAPRITGYRVTNEVRFKVRSLPSAGALLDRAVAAGANEVHNLTFLKDDPRSEQAQALAAAVRAAREKAETIARAAGVQVGEPIDISEGERGPGPSPMPIAMMARAAVPLEAGQVEIVARVQAVFAIR